MNMNGQLSLNNKPIEINLNIFVNKNQNPQIRQNNDYRPISLLSPFINSSQQSTNFQLPVIANNQPFLHPRLPQHSQSVLFSNPIIRPVYHMPNQSPRIVNQNERKNTISFQNPTNYQFNHNLSPFHFQLQSLQRPRFQSMQIKSNQGTIHPQYQPFKRNQVQKEIKIQEDQSQIDMLLSKNLDDRSLSKQSKNIKKIKSQPDYVVSQFSGQNSKNQEKYQNVHPILLYCPICQKNYTNQQKQDHLQFHKNRLNNTQITYIPEPKNRNDIQQNSQNNSTQRSQDIFKLILNYACNYSKMVKIEKLSNQANISEKARNMSQLEDKQSQDEYGHKIKTKRLNIITPEKIRVNLENSISNKNNIGRSSDFMIAVSFKVAAPRRQNLSPRISQINQIDQSQCFTIQKEQSQNNVWIEEDQRTQNKLVEIKQSIKQSDAASQRHEVSSNLERDSQKEKGSVADKLVESKLERYPKIKKLPANKQAFM